MKLPMTERYKSIAGYYWLVVIDPSQPSAGHAIESVVQAIFPISSLLEVPTRSFYMAQIMTRHDFTRYFLNKVFSLEGWTLCRIVLIKLPSFCTSFDVL